jgi:dienelactone hydrolase
MPGIIWDGGGTEGRIVDTLEQRYNLLKSHIATYGPDNKDPLPTVILLHGCGGLRPHVTQYAQSVALEGARAVVVDSFAPRGWGRAFAVSMICTGLVMHGYERAGDILAVLWGLRQEGLTKDQPVILVGFSHGGWAITDLQTSALTRSGDVKIKDPDPRLMDDVKGVYLVYPYLNVPARTNLFSWVTKPRVMVTMADKDHLTPVFHIKGLMNKLKDQGIEVDSQVLDATHAFDEQGQDSLIMRYNEQAFTDSVQGLLTFVKGFNEPMKSNQAEPPVVGH